MRQGAGARASLDAALHHAVLAASPAGACLVTLKDQGGLDLVKLLEQPPVLGCEGGDSGFSVGPISAAPDPEESTGNSTLTPAQSRRARCRESAG